MGFPNPVKEAKKAIEKIIKPAVRAGESAVNKATSAGKSAIRKAEDQAESAVKRVARECEDHLEDVGRSLEEGLTEKIPEAIKDAVHDLAQEASERSLENALNNAADVVEMMAPSSFTLIFGVELALVVQGEVTVAVELPNPVAKLTEIRKWAKNAPSGRAQIIECIKDFGPESLSVEAKVSGNGIAATWSGEDKYDRIDAFLERHGVE